MSFGRSEWPENGEMVVATVSRIESYGAYVTLDEYASKEALLHISEISSRWVRNIRNHVKEGQKVVLQVLRVDASKGQVDLSLRRVNRDDKRKKLEHWKKTRKAETLLKLAAQTLMMTPEDLFNEINPPISTKYNSIYDALEEAAKKNSIIFIELGIKEKIAQVLTEVAKDKIIVKGVTVHGVYEATALGEQGVEDIKGVFMDIKSLGDELDSSVNIYTLGAPKYKLEVTSDDYKKAEIAIDKLVKHTEKLWTNFEGTISFKRM
ncbi:translation initiation factor IF-2 subunit alpha [Candidatus Bathyarchaeota archaeon]|nr:translation initiation factor IF-2 subunit alpha [Candidatus Bathyarchaeota archaeon]